MDSALTLSAFFRRYFTPLFLADARPRTFEAYEETLHHWQKIIGDTAMASLNTTILATFKIALREKHAAA